jgi:hypothetical protein
VFEITYPLNASNIGKNFTITACAFINGVAGHPTMTRPSTGRFCCPTPLCGRKSASSFLRPAGAATRAPQPQQVVAIHGANDTSAPIVRWMP